MPMLLHNQKLASFIDHDRAHVNLEIVAADRQLQTEMFDALPQMLTGFTDELQAHTVLVSSYNLHIDRRRGLLVYAIGIEQRQFYSRTRANINTFNGDVDAALRNIPRDAALSAERRVLNFYQQWHLDSGVFSLFFDVFNDVFNYFFNYVFSGCFGNSGVWGW